MSEKKTGKFNYQMQNKMVITNKRCFVHTGILGDINTKKKRGNI